MKKILIAAVASTAFISSAAFAADTDSQDFIVSGEVMDECSVENPDDVTFTEILINEGAGSTALLLKNGQPASDTQNIWVSCNYAAKLSASSTNDGLIGDNPSLVTTANSGDFTNKIDYRIQLTATDGSFPTLDFRTGSNGGNSPTVNAPGAFHDEAALFVYIDRDDTAKRPVAGTYTDTAILTVGPV